MNTKQGVLHLRAAIKAAGIRARVAAAPGGGSVRVSVPSAESRFTENEWATIHQLAKDAGATRVRGMPIVVGQPGDPMDQFFYFN
jgi:hypothetical protein